MKSKVKLLRITTKPVSINLLIKNQLLFMRTHGFEVFTSSAMGNEVTEFTQREGVVHFNVPFTRKITPFQDLYCLLKLIRVIKIIKPTIVHTHTPKAGLLGMIAAWICRVPIRMHTVAGLPLMEVKGIKRRVLKLTESITYACAHRVYPNSFGLLKFMQSEFSIRSNNQNNLISRQEAVRQKIKVIGNGSSNGIDTNYFSRTDFLEKELNLLRERWRVSEKSLVFGFVGRIVRDKGIVELVEAFKQLPDDLNARLLLVGEFEQGLDPLPQIIVDFLKNDSRVLLPGFQHDVRPWLMMMDVFTFPSYREGFPNAVMQACSLEIPCIVSNINGCNEIVENHVNGLIVPVKDGEALLNAMKLLASNASLRSTFARKSRAHLMANFDQYYFWNQLLEEYKDLVKTKCVHA